MARRRPVAAEVAMRPGAAPGAETEEVAADAGRGTGHGGCWARGGGEEEANPSTARLDAGRSGGGVEAATGRAWGG